MPQSLARTAVHLVFSTKNREPFLAPAVWDELFAYLSGTFAALASPSIRVGRVADHVQALFLLVRTGPLCKAVEEVKKESSKWAKAHVHPDFYWQAGYGAFAVSRSNEDRAAAYIADQERHHAARSYQDEFRGLLQAHGVEWDEEYVWVSRRTTTKRFASRRRAAGGADVAGRLARVAEAGQRPRRRPRAAVGQVAE